ncbi:tetratricopeptide repeat protein [Methylacidiphilales bacterium]|nr:tetratricopeptide repeat protein [Candidatus Methylacidiphilales bacterium]
MAKHSRKKKRQPQVVPVAEIRAAAQSSPFPWKCFLAQVAVIVVTGLWIFWPALHGNWLWDDDELITRNQSIHGMDGLWKIWFEPLDQTDFFPLKVSVEWLEWQLWQSDTFGYHLVNVVLHILNALLVWRLLGKFGLRFAWLGGLIFLVHPVVVESVAWIAELKNTLSLPFFILAICAFLDYDDRRKWRDYLLALGFFLLAMLCKTSMVMFPFVILLHAWWKRGRIGWHDLKASVPFFILSLVLGLITVVFLTHHSIGRYGVEIGGYLSRFVIAGLSITFYFGKCILPIGLMPTYPKWVVDPPSPWQFLPWPILVGVLYGLWTKRATWGRHALFGLGFFLINLAPFVGSFTGSYMRFTWVMDHFLYIPLIGLIGVAVAGMEQIEKELTPTARRVGIGVVTVTLALMAWGSHAYAGLYVDQQTLSTYTVESNPRALPARQSLGDIFLAEGRLEDAIDQYQQVLKIDPDYIDTHCNMGIAYYRLGRIPEAIEHYEYVLKIHPSDPETNGNLGVALLQTGHTQEAIEHLQKALQIDPDLPGVRKILGEALQQQAASPPAK